MIRCAICKLEPEKQQAIDSALRENVSLQTLADRTGLSRTSIWRHSRHMVRPANAKTPPKPARPMKTAGPLPPEPTLPPVDVEASRKRAQARAERLWNEVEGCLTDAKKPVVIVAGDRTVEIPPDPKTRASVVRAGVGVVDLDAKLSGVYDTPAPPLFGSVVFENVILMPKTCHLKRSAKAEPKVVNAQPELPALTDGGTPDREK